MKVSFGERPISFQNVSPNQTTYIFEKHLLSMIDIYINLKEVLF